MRQSDKTISGVGGKQMNLLFTICARAGSKGVKGKNTRDFCGKPLLTYTVAAYALFCKYYGEEFETIRLAVNTDSEMLSGQMNALKEPYLFIAREEKLAGDVVSKMDVIRDTLLKCEQAEKTTFDVVIDLDLTSPLRTAADIKGTLDSLKKDEAADIAYSVVSSRRSPYFNMVSRKEDGYYRTVIGARYTTRQQAPVCYDMNASIYAYDRAYLLNGNAFDRKAVVWEMKDTGVLDIDSEEDLELMEVIGKYYFENKEEYKEIYNWGNNL